jgi:1,6-anhydro-N-acetylmuramate kinase
MTGTSLDGLDCALLEVQGTGAALQARFVRGLSASLGELRGPLRALAEQQPFSAGAIAKLARDFALLHVRACQALRETDVLHPSHDFVCVHGQTVFHEPPCSWQLFEPAPLAHALGVPVVCNLRQADLARGGQGAPITPIADAVLFGARADAIINLGGFCNTTLLTPTAGTSNAQVTSNTQSTLHVRGQDICACNHVLDTIARLALHAPFDAGGAAALRGMHRGHVHAPTRDRLQSLLLAQAAQRRSLGTGDELATVLAQLLHDLQQLHASQHAGNALAADALAATACDAIAHAITTSLPASARDGKGRTALVAGGGTRNAALMHALRARLASCETTDAAGIPSEFREAACFAILGALSADGISIYHTSWPPPTEAGTATPPLAGQWTR